MTTTATTSPSPAPLTVEIYARPIRPAVSMRVAPPAPSIGTTCAQSDGGVTMSISPETPPPPPALVQTSHYGGQLGYLTSPPVTRLFNQECQQPSQNASGKSAPPCRRSIFGNCRQRPQSAVERQSSLSSLSTTSSSMLATPPTEKNVRGVHFRDLDELRRLDPSQTDHLPAVPSPLQRFVHKGASRGVYPLVSPCSILRCYSSGSSSAVPSSPVWSKRDSCSKHHDDDDDNDSGTASTGELSPVTSATITSTPEDEKNIRFDPRVTVTEYPDHTERQWYSECDICRFRSDAVSLAQQYFVRNPHLVARYNKPFVDPVTRTMKKRALFSLPVFGGNDAAVVTLPQRQAAAIQHVLIVDRNRMILDLFRRSLQTIFPYANIAFRQCAEEALVYLRSHDDVDLIIAEETLDRPLPASGRALGGKADSLPGRFGGKHSLESFMRRSPSTGNTGCKRLSGSGLFQELALTGSLQRQPLLVGVSTNPGKEEVQFRKCGADLIWGKPPPKMDENLANSLLSALVKKRNA